MAVTSRYKIAVTSRISTLNAENAPMVSLCTGNMPGTTLVTPKQAQESLEFFFSLIFAHFRSFLLIFAHFCPFLPIFANPTTQLLAHTTFFFWLHIMTQFCFQRFFQAISYRSS